MDAWWHQEVIDGGKLPLMLCFLAFVVTFAVTRTITRMIRAGRGPFRDRVTSDGTHVHHAVPGLLLLVVGAFLAVGAPEDGIWRPLAGVLVGVGVSLVLDEFALILHLEDVYWSGEGQLSVNVVSLTAACLGLSLVGLSPLGVEDLDGGAVAARLGLSTVLLVHGGLVCCVLLKGKYRSALFGLFLPPIVVVAVVRLARPGSWWARRFYGPRRHERAAQRAVAFGHRWGPLVRRWDDLVGGTPSRPDPAPAAGAGAGDD